MTPGEFDEHYVRARSGLFDAYEALLPHIDSIVLVGAQAIYLHTGAAELVIAEFTTDTDFAIEPSSLSGTPLISELLSKNGFKSHEQPGRWLSPRGVYIDIMVPEALAGRPGSRGANLGVHGRRVARQAKGLEGALIDRDLHTIRALDPSDSRSIGMNVAGPGALLVAKLHKLAERVDKDDRVKDKDALDIFRLLQAIPTDTFVQRIKGLQTSEVSRAVTDEAILHLNTLFSQSTGTGVQLAVRATRFLIDPDELTLTLTTLTVDLLRVL